MLKISLCLRRLTSTHLQYVETYLYFNVLSMVTYVTSELVLIFRDFFVFLQVFISSFSFLNLIYFQDNTVQNKSTNMSLWPYLSCYINLSDM